MSQATSKLNNWKQKEVYFKQQYIPNFKTPMQIEHLTTICIVSHNPWPGLQTVLAVIMFPFAYCNSSQWIKLIS